MLDPHKDREPGYDARVITFGNKEWAKSKDDGKWHQLEDTWRCALPLNWADLAELHPNGLVWMP